MKITTNPVDPQLFFSKNDPQDIRLGDCTQILTENIADKHTDLVVWGYPDDEGIHLNGGRTGASLAPEIIRKYFYKMTPHPDCLNNNDRPQILDAGDLLKPLHSLIERHEQASHIAHWASEKQIPWISLGGGHDYGFADGDGFLRWACKEQTDFNNKPLIINFDAHLDVRPMINSQANSGTPFRRLLEKYPNQFDFLQVGIQPQCNSKHHVDWAKSQGAEILWLEQIEKQSLLSIIKNHLSKNINRPLWVSLDIDAIISSEAPGCSQSWGQGLKSQELIQTLKWLFENFQWKSFSIYEVSPTLDTDNRTSKLAALFMHYFLTWNCFKNAK